MKKVKNLLLLFLCGAFFFTCAVGSSDSDGDLETKKTTTSEKKEELQILEDTGYADEYGFSYYIEGKAKNTTDKKFSYVQISFNVYDEEGTVIGNCWDNQGDIMGGETWKFKAICSGDAKLVASYKYTGYSAW